VFVHADAGTANACMAIQNVFRHRVPVMLFAGRAPFTLRGELLGSRDTCAHVVQDSFDLASVVRPFHFDFVLDKNCSLTAHKRQKTKAM
jgi:acetolactate synthase-1/2/3 large subunit